jgi:hypothetical protein
MGFLIVVDTWRTLTGACATGFSSKVTVRMTLVVSAWNMILSTVEFSPQPLDHNERPFGRILPDVDDGDYDSWVQYGADQWDQRLTVVLLMNTAHPRRNGAWSENHVVCRAGGLVRSPAGRTGCVISWCQMTGGNWRPLPLAFYFALAGAAMFLLFLRRTPPKLSFGDVFEVISRCKRRLEYGFDRRIE